MTPREAGLLLLTSHLGDPERRPLTGAQYWKLCKKILTLVPEEDRELDCDLLLSVGCSKQEAQHIVQLLSQEALLETYLRKAARCSYGCLTRLNPEYPQHLLRVMKTHAPSVLWTWGNTALLQESLISVVGSRELSPQNQAFAALAGQEIARDGCVLVSGGARGADLTAQQGAAASGGSCIVVLPDCFLGHRREENILYLCQDSFDLPFTARRALSRNHLIHALGQVTLVAQSSQGRGGTWAGVQANLQHHWSPVYCYQDGSPAAQALFSQGAIPIDRETLSHISRLSGID